MNPTVFLVDDSKTARMMTKHWIKAQFPDHQVFEAGSGEEAVEMLDQLPSKFTAILDYNMPGMRGIELAQEIQQRFPDARVLLCTANIQDAVRNKAAAIGIEFVPKPMTPPKVKQILQAAGSQA